MREATANSLQISGGKWVVDNCGGSQSCLLWCFFFSFLYFILGTSPLKRICSSTACSVLHMHYINKRFPLVWGWGFFWGLLFVLLFSLLHLSWAAVFRTLCRLVLQSHFPTPLSSLLSCLVNSCRVDKGESIFSWFCRLLDEVFSLSLPVFLFFSVSCWIMHPIRHSGLILYDLCLRLLISLSLISMKTASFENISGFNNKILW